MSSDPPLARSYSRSQQRAEQNGDIIVVVLGRERAVVHRDKLIDEQKIAPVQAMTVNREPLADRSGEIQVPGAVVVDRGKQIGLEVVAGPLLVEIEAGHRIGRSFLIGRQHSPPGPPGPGASLRETERTWSAPLRPDAAVRSPPRRDRPAPLPRARRRARPRCSRRTSLRATAASPSTSRLATGNGQGWLRQRSARSSSSLLRSSGSAWARMRCIDGSRAAAPSGTVVGLEPLRSGAAAPEGSSAAEAAGAGRTLHKELAKTRQWKQADRALG